MSEPLFVRQDQLEDWIGKGSVTFADNVLTLVAEQALYDVEPAVRVTTLLDGPDELNLLNGIFRVAALVEQGVEVFQDSLIANETAYQCEVGFVGTLQGEPEAAEPIESSTPAAALPAIVNGPPPLPKRMDQPQDEVDLLTEFLLKNM